MARTEAEFNIVARDKTKRGFDSARKRARNAADSITKAARVAGGALAVFGGTRAIRGALRAAAQIDEMGDVAGISAERIQELTKSFSDMAGVSESVSQGGLRRFNRRLDLARDGTGAAVDTLDKLNITLEQDTESALNQSIARLQEMAKTESIVGEASQLFGEDAGPKMAAAISQGEDALRDQTRALRDHGRVMSNEASEAARRLNDRYNEIADTLNTRFQRAIVGATSGIQDFLNVEPERFQIQEELKELRTSLNGLLDLRQRLQDGNPFFTFFADLDGTNERIQETNSRMVKLQKRLKELRPDGPDDFGGASKKQNELLSQKQELLEAIQTPAERFAAQQEQINELVEKTSITQEQANRRIAQLREEILGSSIEVQTLTEEVQALNQAAEQRSAELLAERIEQIRRTVDPTRAGLLELGDNLDALSRSDLPTDQVEQLKIGLIDAAKGGSELVDAFNAVEQAADDRIAELGKDVAGDSGEDAGEEFASGFERQAERIGDSLADALMTGDFDGVGNAVASSVGGSIGDSVTRGVGSALGDFAGSSAISGAAGGILGGIAGQLVGSIFGGGSEDITRQINLAIEDAIVTGFEQITIETSGLLGGTTTIFNELGLEITEAVENSFERSIRNVRSTLDSIGADYERSVEDFEFALKDTDPSEFVKEAADQFLRESTSVAEVFREAGETLVESINRVADDFKLAVEALDVAEVDISNFIDNLAEDIQSQIRSQVDNLRDERSDLQGDVSDINRDLRENNFGGAKGKAAAKAAQELIFARRDIEDEIEKITDKIIEQKNRFDDVSDIAKGKLGQDLIDFISKISNISTEQAQRNLDGLTESLENIKFTEAEQAQRTIDDARESLERFSDIGVDASASVEKITQQLSEFIPKTAEQTASLLVAAGAVEDLKNATDNLSDSAEERLEKEAIDDVVSARETLIDQLEAEKRQAEQTAQSFRQIGQELERFQRGIQFGNNSPLSPQEQLDEARSEFLNVRNRALGVGDVSQEQQIAAQERLSDVSDQFLNQAREFFASGEGFQNAFNLVNDTIDEVERNADRQLSDAEQQVNLLDTQIDNQERMISVIQGLGPPITTIEQAVQNLEQVMGDAQNDSSDLARSNFDSIEGPLNSIFQLAFGRNAGEEGRNFFGDSASLNDVITGAQPADVQRAIDRGFGQQLVRLNPNVNQGDISGGGNNAVSQEIRSLREEVRQLRQATVVSGEQVTQAVQDGNKSLRNQERSARLKQTGAD